jgi:2'-5' RNA ligase
VDHDARTYAVVLHFDDDTEDQLLALWAALDVHGVDSAARTYGAGYRPHLTLAIVDADEPDRLVESLEAPLAEVGGLPVTLASLGFFVPHPCPAYLSVTPTSRLLALHEQVYDALDGTLCWDHYLPGAWMPHCTLAMRVDLTSPVAHVVSRTALPIHATVSAAHLVEIPKDGGVGSTLARFGADAQIPSQAVARHRAGPRHRRVRRLTPIPLR